MSFGERHVRAMTVASAAVLVFSARILLNLLAKLAHLVLMWVRLVASTRRLSWAPLYHCENLVLYTMRLMSFCCGGRHF